MLLLLFLVVNALISPAASQTSPLVRQNTQCSLATIVPSDVTTLRPYIDNSNTTFDVNSTTGALRDNAPPQIFTCPNDSAYGRYDPTRILSAKSAWYKFTPSVSNYYDITPTDIFPYQPFPQWISIIEGTTCSTGPNTTLTIGQTPIGCKFDSVRGVYLQAKKTYQITIFIDATDLDYYYPLSVKERFTLNITPTMNRPTNDDCSNATQIPSTVPLPYTSAGIDVSGATIQINETLASCDVYRTFRYTSRWVPKKDKTNFGGGSIWYTYTPPTTGYYNFSTVGTIHRNLQYVTWPAPITIAVYDGNGGSKICNFQNRSMGTSIKEVYCKREEGSLDRTTKLQAGTLYYIQLIPDYYTQPVYDKLFFTIDRTEAPPINDECTNAITVDPSVGVNTTVSITYASTELLFHPLGLKCNFDLLTDPGIWYKYVSTGGSNFITTQLCANLDYLGGYRLYVFEGSSCQTLKCVQSFFLHLCPNNILDRFVTASEPTTYYFYLRPFNTLEPTYFSVDFQGGYFNMINAGNDTVIVPLLEKNASFSYSDVAYQEDSLTSSQLNIQAYFNPNKNIRSSSVTLIQNKQKRIRRCERLSPFSVFGNRNGNYSSVSLPIGNYTVSAIPYTQPDCQGPPLLDSTITNDFTIQGCQLLYLVRRSDNSFMLLDPVMTSLPCNSFISGQVWCAFPAQKVKVELINVMNDTTNTTSIIVDTVYQSLFSFGQSRSFFYIGKTSNATSLGITPIINRLPPSPKYRMTVTIDDIVHPSYEFAIQNKCTRG